MPAATFDTLRASRALQAAGIEREHAEAIAEGINQAVNQRSQDYATKADIAELRADNAEMRAATKADIDGLRADNAEMRAATKADIDGLRTETKADNATMRAEMRAEIANMKVALYRAGALAVGIILAGVGLIVRFLA